MVGAGGNLGAVIGLRAFFFSGDIRRDEGFLRLGALVIGIKTLMFFNIFIYFPPRQFGSMLTPAQPPRRAAARARSVDWWIQWIRPAAHQAARGLPRR